MADTAGQAATWPVRPIGRPLPASARRPVAISDRTVVCFPFAGGMVGGSHISALGLIRSLDRSRYEPLVLLHEQGGALEELLRSEDVEFEHAPFEVLSRRSFGMLARAPRAMLSAARFLRERNVRIVHTNEGPMHATWTLPARLAGARHVWHHRGNPDAKGLRLLAPVLASRVICVSRFAMPAPGIWSARRKSSVVYSPFNSAASPPDRDEARAKLITAIDAPDDALVLAFIGHFADRKRPLVFIDTIAALRDLGLSRPIVGLMFGEEFEPGQQRLVEERISQLGVDDNIWLMGFRRPMEPWLAGCDLLVVPAVEEPFGRTLVEAMLLGTPVIAAASGGNLEAIRDGETGMLVPPDQPQAFASRIAELLDHPEDARAMAGHAQREARAKFAVGSHVKAVTQVYDECVS